MNPPPPQIFNKNQNLKQIKTVYALSFFSGFLTLGLEVIWVRIISFAGHSVPQTFAYTLAIFLIGLSIGAWLGKLICQKHTLDTTSIGRFFFLASFTDLLMMYLAYQAMHFWNFIGIAPIFIVISATIHGLIFPLVHHIGTEQNKSGKQISNVYFANVLGSALSPILISFIALDYFSSQQVYILICLISIWLTVLSVRGSNKINKEMVMFAWLGFAVSFALLLPEKIFHRLSFLEHNAGELIENKHGFIQVYEEKNEKIVYGANVYDGKFNTNLFTNSNGIDRAYLLPAIKKDIKNVLVIGLSTGSWVRVLSSIPEIEKMTVIEINPAYTKLIKKHPEVSPILQDKRLNIVVDDGRKWLRQHPHEQFDAIIMNTTWYWRAYASNLLSKDFLELVRPHLKQDGLMLYNSTGLQNVYMTATRVFPYVYQYKAFVYVSKEPFVLPQQQPAMVQQNLARLRWHDTNQPVFTPQNLPQGVKELVTLPFTQHHASDYPDDSEIITDDNMLSEYKYGRHGL